MFTSAHCEGKTRNRIKQSVNVSKPYDECNVESLLCFVLFQTFVRYHTSRYLTLTHVIREQRLRKSNLKLHGGHYGLLTQIAYHNYVSLTVCEHC